MLSFFKNKEEKAKDLYSLWSKKASSKKKEITFDWPLPEDAVCFGYSTRITYESDKWKKDGEMERYAHRFASPETKIIVPRPKNNRGYDHRRLFSANPTSCPQAPTNHFFTILGKCLHLEFFEDRESPIQYRRFPPRNLPTLAVQEDRENVLILVWENEPCWIVTSPMIRITAHGIVN